MKHEPYPLEWPIGQARTPASRRRRSQFKHLQWGRARDLLLDELGRMGAERVTISTDVRTRGDGVFYASAREPDDPGVAVYFRRRGRWYSLACDSYLKLAENVRALGATVEALRRIERHGASDLLEQALSGFAALPAAIAVRPKWWESLGFDAPPTSLKVARLRYRSLVAEHHPDKGGDPGQMAILNDAIREAREELTS